MLRGDLGKGICFCDALTLFFIRDNNFFFYVSGDTTFAVSSVCVFSPSVLAEMGCVGGTVFWGK